jgi:ACR3 family arsenite efflux pump ArsB
LFGRAEVAQVNLPVGALIWVTIIPMLVEIDFSGMTQVKSQWRGIGDTIFVQQNVWLLTTTAERFFEQMDYN